MFTDGDSGTSARVGVVDVGVARRLGLGPVLRDDLDREAVVEREHVVLLRLLEPALDERLRALRLLGGEVARLGAVLVDVVELPLVLVEVADARRRAVDGDDLPAVLPHPARAEHAVVLAVAAVGPSASNV